MSKFATAMASSATTLNGATSLSTADPSGKKSGRMALFFKSVRGLNLPQLYDYLHSSSRENLVDTFLLAFHIRDCRGGKGERDLGRAALKWLFLNYPKEFERVMPLMAEYGRWDDLLELFPNVFDISDIERVRNNFSSNIESKAHLESLQELQSRAVRVVGKQLECDIANMKDGKPVSICAKWAPTENGSLDRKHHVVRTLCRSMGWTNREYRRSYIAPLRRYLNIVERYMCSNKWDAIEYSNVPSCAMKRLKKAFEKHSPETFAAWKAKLQKGEVQIKAKQLQPHELIREIRNNGGSDTVCESQWNVLETEVKKLGTLRDAICVVDVSGSMKGWYPCKKNISFTPMDVSIALGIIISNAVEGPFHNHVISFHDSPSFTVLQDGSLYDRLQQIKAMPWGCSTNLQATFDLILKQALNHNLKEEDMPKRIFIISDMQFNSVDTRNSSSNFQAIENKYRRAGYERPQIVFWNVNGSNTDFPVSIGDHGTALISGFSPSVMKSILNGKDFSPWTALRDTIDDERYDPVRNNLERDIEQS